MTCLKSAIFDWFYRGVVTKTSHKYLCHLDNIEAEARKKYARCSYRYMTYIVRSFISYWRYLQRKYGDEIPDIVWNELYFFFNEKLYEIARSRLDLMWLVYEYDDQGLFHDEFEVKPFWRNGY